VEPLRAVAERAVDAGADGRALAEALEQVGLELSVVVADVILREVVAEDFLGRGLEAVAPALAGVPSAARDRVEHLIEGAARQVVRQLLDVGIGAAQVLLDVEAELAEQGLGL